ncbi:MAG: TetR/AcrR family transcriptional regulator [Deltaproteobacteria bacterium]|nr:TetR/AcrR family transcriptional regulator [Deltaproteobacteria bacterium]
MITPQTAVSLRNRRKSGRTQAERSAETREKIIAGATACIAERGFGNATMFNIAHRAGVTWGAMQHHFGDKDAILDAVIDRSLREFTALMEGLRVAEPEIERRVRSFTRRAWVAFKGPYYRVILDILLHRPEKTERIAAAFTALWTQIFGDLRLSQERRLAAQRFTFTMLSGIATESVVIPGIDPSPLHFAVLERTLTDMLRRENRAHTRSGATGARINPGGNENRKGVRDG